jgi:MSHA biogenesis protein MshQ
VQDQELTPRLCRLFLSLLVLVGNAALGAECDTFGEFAGYGIIGDDGFNYGNNSKINENGINGHGNTPTPTGDVDTVHPTFPGIEPSVFPSTGGDDLTNPDTIPSGSYDQISISTNRATRFSGGGANAYYITRLSIGNNSVVSLAPGDYFVEALSIGNDSSIVIDPSGRVRLYVKHSLQGGNEIYMNSGGDAPNLWVFLYQGASMSIGNGNKGTSNFSFNGIIYSPFDDTRVNFGNNNDIQGAILVAGQINVGNNTTFDYGADVETAVEQAHSCEKDPVPDGLDHIRIEHASGSGLTCNPDTLTIRACADAACNTGYTGGVTGSLVAVGAPTVNWVGTSGFAIPTGDDSVTKGVHVTTAGSVVFNVDTGSLTPPITTAGATCNFGTPACTYIAADSGFLFDVPDHIAETSQSFLVSAVRTNPTTQACVPAFSNRTNVPVNFRCTYSNPGSGTMPVRVGQGNTDTPLAASTASACSGGVTIALDFDAAGVAQDVRAIYADVGRMGLTATYTGSGSEAGLVMAGSDSFVAKPASFGLAALRADGTANPAATDANGEVFVRAGEDFTLWVEARNALDQRAPNYGQETPAEGVKLTPSVVLPTPGNHGTLVGSFGAFGVDCTGSPGTKGRACGSHFNWNEVGVLALTPTIADGDYLGAGDIAATPVSPFGRFIPHHFGVSTNTPSFAPGCGGFTYLEQDFTYATAPIITITARSMDGSKTSNYTGEFWKLGGLANFTASNAALPAGVGLTQVSAGPMALECLGCGGELSTTLSGTYHYTRSNALIGPFDADPVIKFEVMDGDGVAYGSPPGTYDLGPVGFNTSKTVRSGRAYAQDVYGTGGRIGESLTMPLYAQYFDGSGWVASDFDYCSTFQYSETENDITTALAASGMGYFSGGTAALTLQVSADGGTPGGNSVLTFDWDAVPWFKSVSTPAATAIFGAYRNDRRIIHWREAP